MRDRGLIYEVSHANNVIIKFHISGLCVIVVRVVHITFRFSLLMIFR